MVVKKTFTELVLCLSIIFANCLAASEKTCEFPAYCLWKGTPTMKMLQKEGSVPVTPAPVTRNCSGHSYEVLGILFSAQQSTNMSAQP